MNIDMMLIPHLFNTPIIGCEVYRSDNAGVSLEKGKYKRAEFVQYLWILFW